MKIFHWRPRRPLPPAIGGEEALWTWWIAAHPGAKMMTIVMKMMLLKLHSLASTVLLLSLRPAVVSNQSAWRCHLIPPGGGVAVRRGRKPTEASLALRVLAVATMTIFISSLSITVAQWRVHVVCSVLKYGLAVCSRLWRIHSAPNHAMFGCEVLHDHCSSLPERTRHQRSSAPCHCWTPTDSTANMPARVIE